MIEACRYLEAGAGVHAQQDVDADGGGPGVPAVTGTKYLHGDMTRSTMLLTDEYGEAVSPTGGRAVVGYTAFGEPVVTGGVGVPPANVTIGGDLPAGFVRFGYAGGWGYQAGLHVAAPSTQADDPLRGTGLLSLYGPRADLPPIALQHVGARWYDPGLGRFVQRDPIGIEGGMNVYAYCGANPITGVDAEGLEDRWADEWWRELQDELAKLKQEGNRTSIPVWPKDPGKPLMNVYEVYCVGGQWWYRWSESGANGKKHNDPGTTMDGRKLIRVRKFGRGWILE